jgi:hypothetical protein
MPLIQRLLQVLYGHNYEASWIEMTTFNIVLVVLMMFAGMLAFLEIGLRLGKRAGGTGKAFGPLSGAVFALMGLLIAFSFSGAGTRFEMKRQLIVAETNAIETAYLRIDLLPEARQEKMRETFRQYLDSRLAFYRTIADRKAAAAEMARTEALQHDIWSQAIVGCREVGVNPTNTLVLSSLNAMIDITTNRMVALQTHPPGAVLILLGILPLICSLLAGYDAAEKGRSFLHMLGFAVILAIAIFIVLDYEYPRAGLFIHLDATDQVLIDLRQSMNR